MFRGNVILVACSICIVAFALAMEISDSPVAKSQVTDDNKICVVEEGEGWSGQLTFCMDKDDALWVAKALYSPYDLERNGG